MSTQAHTPTVQPNDELIFIRSNSIGNPLVTIKADGTIIYGEGYTPDAAAKALWEAFSFSGVRAAAAPDMLAALKDCLPLFDLVACGEVQERVCAAIAKAEGRS